MMGRFLRAGTTKYFPSLKLQVWHLRDLLTVRSLTFLPLFLSDTFLTCLMDAASNSQQEEKKTSPPNTLTSCRPIRPLKTCIQKFHVWKHLQRRPLRIHKLTIWKKRGVRGLGFSYLLKMGLDSGLTLHATLAFWKMHWNLQAKGPFFYFWCMINEFH